MLLEKLEGLPGVNLGVLALPEGIRALGPDTLLARNREGLKSEHVRVRGDVAELMRRFGPGPAALATLVQILAEKDAQPRQVAVRVLASMGKAVAAALPALWAGLDDPIPYVGTNCQSAIGTIETAKDEPGATERAEKTKAVREEIARSCDGTNRERHKIILPSVGLYAPVRQSLSCIGLVGGTRTRSGSDGGQDGLGGGMVGRMSGSPALCHGYAENAARRGRPQRAAGCCVSCPPSGGQFSCLP